MRCPICHQEMEETETDDWRFSGAWICKNIDCNIGYIAVIYEFGGTWKVLSEKGKELNKTQ